MKQILRAHVVEIHSQALVEQGYVADVAVIRITRPFWVGIQAIRNDTSKKGGTMGPSKSFYGESLLERNKRTYGYHPKCKKCLILPADPHIRKEGECENPQYAAVGVDDFYCADYREE